MIISGLQVIENVPWIWGIPCKKDANHKGSIHDKIGLSEWICPHCNAHLSHKLICLNACHLTAAGLRRFEQEMRTALAQEKIFKREQHKKAIDFKFESQQENNAKKFFE